MKNTIILLTSALLVSVGQSQSFKCPDISFRNNGNNVNCAGDASNPVNSSLSTGSYSIPTSSKAGRATLEYASKLTDAPVISAAVNSSGQALDVEFGPPNEWVTTNKNTYELKYCFYKNNLPASGFYQLTFINASTGSVYGKCSYDGQTSLTAPTITTQPTGKLNDCKGNNYTFSCSATANGNNTTLSYQWKKNGTAISGATSSSYSISSVTNANNGDYIVVVTETYANGNAVQQESNVAKYSVDEIKPVAIAQNVNLNLDATGSGSITAAQVNNGSSDACGIKSYSLNKSDFDCSNVGNNTVTLTVTDNNDNVSTATAMVTVKDVTAPVAKAKAFTLNLDANGQATLLSTDINDGSSDACGIATYTLSKENFNDKNVGVNTVTLTVTDNNGNSASADAVVTVKDITAPEAKAKNIDVELDENGNVSIDGEDVDNGSTDACGIKSKSVSPSSFTCANLGNNTVTLTVTDVNGNTSTTTSIVTVLDKVAPVAKAKSITIELDATGSATIVAGDINNNSTDNCGIKLLSADKSAFDCSNVGNNSVILTVTDNNDNVSTATAMVTVKDATAPMVKVKAFTLNLDANGQATLLSTDFNDGSSDACGIATYSLSKENFDKNDLGNQEVTLTVVDKNGNKSTDKAIVTVKDTISPIVKANDIEIIITNGGDLEVVGADVNNGSKDNCEITTYTLTGAKTKFGCADRGNSFIVKLTAQDASGNSAYATAKITVKGSATTAPSITHDWTEYSGRYFYPYHSAKVKFTTTTKSGYSYSWSGNDISGSTSGSSVEVLPTKEGNLTLTATAKDADGCTASSTAKLCVFNIAVPGSNNSKVYVCHNKGSNAVGAPDNVTLETSISGAKSHLTQHSKDGIGVCGTTYDCSKLSARSKQDESGVVGQLLTTGELSFMVYPNPSDDRFMIEVESEGVTTVSQVRILDMSGRIVETATLKANVAIEVGRDLIPGIYNIQVSNGGMVSSSRLIKQ